MSNTSDSLSKVCNSCGQLKPLSSFLHLSDKATEYGSLCDACRKKGIPTSVIDEEDTKSTTGNVIDTKSKVQSDTDKENEHKRVEELYHEDRDEQQALDSLEAEKTEDIIKREVKHRQTFIDKQRFLTQKKTDSPAQQTSRWAQEKGREQAFNADQATKNEQAGLEEKKQTEIDLTAPMEDTRIAGKIKYSGDSFKRFTALIKKSSPIGNTFEQKSHPPENEKPSDFVEKNWGPKTRR